MSAQIEDEIEYLIEKTTEPLTPHVPDGKTYNLQADCFCSGFVVKITQTWRRMYMIPFYVCTVSHTGLVCETTRNRAYYVEFVENNPILIHDVTREWSKREQNEWYYGGYHWFFDKSFTLRVNSINIQQLAKMYDSLAAFRGDYILSGNNCHVVAEEMISHLSLHDRGPNMHYGTYLGVGEKIFDANKEIMPIFYF